MSANGNLYVGRRAFDVGDWEIFFGRNLECQDVSKLWQTESVAVLHGPAGCGKTSLLRAGVTRTLSEHAVGPLLGHTSFGSPFPQAALSDHNRYTVAVLSSWYPGESLTKLATLSLTDVLRDRAIDSNTADDPLPILIAIDQFEEMFRGPRATPEREAFFADLATALRVVPQLRILLVIRSEYLDELTPYKQQLNLKDRAYYRITALGRQAALDAVRCPMEKIGQRFTSGVAELVVRELLTAPATDIIEAGNRELAATVEPVQLQEVCSRLAQVLCTDGWSFSLDSVQIAEYADKALAAFCIKVVFEVAAKLGVTASAVVAWVKRTFIGIDGSRLRIAEPSINSVNLQLAAASALLDQHLLIAEFESGTRWYKLASDRLILAVQQLKPPVPGDKIPIFDTLDHLRAATSALAADDLDLAERHARDALVSQEQNVRLQADAHSLLGNVAYHRGHMDEAEKQYMRAAQLCEELQDQSAVGSLLAAMGRIHAIRGRRAAALEELQSAVTRVPGDLALQTEFAKALSRVGQIQAAAAVFGTVLANEPNSIEALVWRGQIQADLGYALAALDDLQTLRRLRPSASLQPEIRSAYALALARTGLADAAMKEADAALASVHNNGVVFLRAALVARATGSPERAKELLRMAAGATDPALSSDQLSEVEAWMTSLQEANL